MTQPRHLRPVPAEPVAETYKNSPATHVAHEFLRKPRGRDYPYDICFDLLEDAIEHHARHGGDPWRWSAADIADLLSSGFPEVPSAAPDRLKYLPDLMSDFIRFAHPDVDAETATVLATIDTMRPEFLCAVGADDWQTPLYHDVWRDPWDVRHPLQYLADAVGGMDALTSLDDLPLPDEPFVWSQVPAELAPLLQDVVPLLDALADESLTIEHRTAMRRFVVRLANRDAKVLRRKGTHVRRAAAIAWVVLRANDDLGAGDRLLTTRELLDWFGISGDVSSRARTVLHDAGGSERWASRMRDRIVLGDPHLLTARRRRQLIEDGDRP